MLEKQKYEKPVLVRRQKLAQIAAVVPVSGKVPSDRRLKVNVEPLTQTADGLQIYAFEYLWSPQRYSGVMAQDLLQDARYSHAVDVGPNGFYRVNYDALGLKMEALEGSA
jgi:hypothetical protein